MKSTAIRMWLSKHAFDSPKARDYLGEMASLLCSGAKPGAGIAGEVWLCCMSLAGTCLVGMANKHVSHQLKLWWDGEHVVAVCDRCMHGVVSSKIG